MTLAAKVRRGDVRSLARLLSMVENNEPQALPHLKALFPHTGSARVIGITGPAGAGKSSLINLLIKEFRKDNKRLAVLAVDPTSPFSGGAVLGDRLRMREHLSDSKVFIRSIASRQGPGGIAYALPQAIRILDAANFRTILVETAGAGQDEVGVLGLAGVVLVVLSPGIGDDVQALKAGLLEIGDLLVINKSDLPESDLLEGYLLQAGIPEETSLRVSALKGEGLPLLVNRIDRIFAKKDPKAIWENFCKRELQYSLQRTLVEEGMKRIGQKVFDQAVNKMVQKKASAYALSRTLIRKGFESKRP